MDIGNTVQSTGQTAKTITIKNIQLLTQSKRRRGFARQYYIEFRVADSNPLWRTKEAKETGQPPEPIVWDDSWFFDGDDCSILVVDIYQKHHIGKDKLITTLTRSVGVVLEKLHCGVFEETVGKKASDGSDSSITIKFSLTAELHEADDAAQRQAADAITKATSALGPLGSTPRAVGQLGSVVDTGTTIISGALTFENTWGVLLKRMTLFNKIVAGVAAIHPYTSLAWSVISAVSQLLVNQKARDDQIIRLAGAMSDVFSFVHDAEPLKAIKAHIRTITLLIQQVTECGYFIAEYTKQKSFWVRVAKYSISDIDVRVTSYETSLRELKTAFLEQVTLQTGLTVVRIMNATEQSVENIDLNDMPWACGAKYAEEKGCLLGTRESLLREICDILNNPAEDAPRVCLLTGVAGSGKSAVAHTIARLYEEQKRLGSSYCFSSSHVAGRNPGNLFSTIARGLSDRDSQYKFALWKVIKDDRALRTSTSPIEQLKHLVVEPSKYLHTIGPLVIVIDALDESGDPDSRKQLMQAISTQFDQNTLPTNLHFLITTRPETDILTAFARGSHLVHKQMSDIPDQAVDEDMEKFVRHSLGHISELESSWPNGEWCRVLVEHSHRLFQWARTACNFIRGEGTAGLSPGERLDILVEGSHDKSLDKLYRAILGTILERDFTVDLARRRFHHAMAIILSLREPLSLASLRALFGEDLKSREIFMSLGSLLDGVFDEEKPIRPLHTTFRDFLLDENRSLSFHVSIVPEHSLYIGRALLAYMQRMLKFNMCNLTDSRLRNSEVIGLTHRINKAIPPHLSYSCRYWMNHLQHTECSSEVLAEVTQFFKKFFPYWLEAISLLSHSSPLLPVLSALETCFILQTWARNPEVASLSSEAFRFIQTFAPVLRVATPHLYLSAMAQTPSSSSLNTLWADHLQKHISVTPMYLATWPPEVLTLEGHTGPIPSVAYSPDGRYIVSSSWDKTIRIWDAITGQSVAGPFQGHNNYVLSVAYSYDGRHVASGSSDKTIRVWDVATGQTVMNPIQGHTDSIHSVAYSFDGRHIVSGSSDNTVRVWDAATGQAVIGPFQGHTGSVHSVAYSSDGHIVSGSGDTTIRVWDATTGLTVVGPIQGHTHTVSSVAYSPDGKHIVSGSYDQSIRVWDATIGQTVVGPFQGHTKSIYSVVYSYDGRYIVSGSADKTIRVWDATTGQAVAGPFQGHMDNIWSVAYSPNGKHIISGSEDKTIRVWDTTIGQTTIDLDEGHTNVIWSVTYSPDGGHIVSGSSDTTIRVWDANTGKAVIDPLYGHMDSVTCIAYSPDGRHVISGSWDKTMRVWDTTTGQAVREEQTSVILCIAYSPDARHIVSGALDETIRVWDVGTDQAVISLFQGHKALVWSVAYSSNGHIISGSGDKTIRVWDKVTGQTIAGPFQGHISNVLSVACSPDGQHIVSGSSDNTIRIWDISTGLTVVGPFHGHTGSVCSVVYSPDGRYIVSGSWDKTIRIWDATTGLTVAGPFQGHTHHVNSVAYSPDGESIVSGSHDYCIKVWKVKDLFLYQTMYLNDGWIQFSQDSLFAWVAPWNRNNFYFPVNSVVMAPSKCYQVQSDTSLVGEAWISCWK